MTTIDDLLQDGEAFMTHVRRQIRVNEISQAEMAAASCVTREQLNRWMRGKIVPGLENRLKLNAGLNIVLHGVDL